MDPIASEKTTFAARRPAKVQQRHCLGAGLLHWVIDSFALAAGGYYPTAASIYVAKEIFSRRALAADKTKPVVENDEAAEPVPHDPSSRE